MDQRTIFESPEKLLAILLNLMHQKQKVSLLLDLEGLTRLEGNIVRIEERQPLEKTLITVNNDALLLAQVIAVNGIFRSDYSEC